MYAIAYYAAGLERKRSVYERDIDLVLFLATIMATIIETMFVEREESLAALFAGILAIYAMFDDFRRYERKKEREIYGLYDETSFSRCSQLR